MHGVKVASFLMDGQELICLPQVFDLFLKHLVGGLHTVYTKLKRLDISPVVCTVEQVRILRGLGAIQPGVNRCKLITRKDFETLFTDCTNARRKRQMTRKQAVNRYLCIYFLKINSLGMSWSLYRFSPISIILFSILYL